MTQVQSASAPRLVRGLLDANWHVARLARANILLMGSDSLLETIVDALRPELRQPIDVWHPAVRLVLPPITATGTLILLDVGAMPRDDQRRLCDWLEASAGRTRVVSTTPQPLYRLLETGTFMETLYYRLNVLCFQVAAPDSTLSRAAPP